MLFLPLSSALSVGELRPGEFFLYFTNIVYVEMDKNSLHVWKGNNYRGPKKPVYHSLAILAL